MLAILTPVADPTADDAPTGAETASTGGMGTPAGRESSGMAPEVRGWAIFDDTRTVAASNTREEWLEAGRSLLAAADKAAGQGATHAHVATELGEAFIVRSGGLVMVAVTDRFALASLVFADMRSALRAASRQASSRIPEAA